MKYVCECICYRHLETTFRVTNTNLFCLVEIVWVVSPTLDLEDARGAVGWRDEGAVDPGDFFTITHGSGHFCHIGYCTLPTQIRFYISYSKVPPNSTLSHPHTNPNLMNTVILSQGMQQRLWLSLNWKEGTQATNWTMGHVQGRTYIPFAARTIWGCIWLYLQALCSHREKMSIL